MPQVVGPPDGGRGFPFAEHDSLIQLQFSLQADLCANVTNRTQPANLGDSSRFVGTILRITRPDDDGCAGRKPHEASLEGIERS